MKKFAFTLAEALLALGIIGVVSALTLPSVTLEHRKRTYGASLAAAVSDFETAMSTMIMRDGAYDLLDTKAWKYVAKDLEDSVLNLKTDKEEAEKFEEYITFFSRPIGGSVEDYYKDDNGNKINIYTFYKATLVDDFLMGTPFEMKNGITYFLDIDYTSANFDKQFEDELLNKGTNLYSIAARVFIDVNGKAKPNTVGRDIFYFLLGADGKLYPFSGKDHKIKLGSSPTDYTGYGYTARLVENHYKMNY